MGLYDYLAKRNPGLKRELRMARINQTVEEFLRKCFRTGMMFGIVLAMTTFVLIDTTTEEPISALLWGIGVLMVGTGYFYYLLKQRPKIYIKKRRQKIDRDLLFVGQYMLVKLQSGLPLFNTLIHASHEYNETGFFFREIVQDINTGTTLERAIDQGRDLCPSENMKKILSQIVTSLKTGANVTQSLKSSLHDISHSLLLEVRAYNKKLNSLLLFYMILGTVIPSIGIAMFVIFLSFAGISLHVGFLFITTAMLAGLQFVFVTLVNSARPTVNL